MTNRNKTSNGISEKVFWVLAKEFGYDVGLIRKLKMIPYVLFGNNHHNHWRGCRNPITQEDKVKAKQNYNNYKKEIEAVYGGKVEILGAIPDEGCRFMLIVRYIPLGFITTRRREHLNIGCNFWSKEVRKRKNKEKERINNMTDREKAEELGYDLAALEEFRYVKLYLRFGQKSQYDFNLDKGKDAYSKKRKEWQDAIHSTGLYKRVGMVGAIYKTSRKGKLPSHHYFVLALQHKKDSKHKLVDIRDDGLCKFINGQDSEKCKCSKIKRRRTPHEILENNKKRYGGHWGRIIDARETPGGNIQFKDIEHGWQKEQSYSNAKYGHVPQSLLDRLKHDQDEKKVKEIDEHLKELTGVQIERISGIMKPGEEGEKIKAPNRPYVIVQCCIHQEEQKRIAVGGIKDYRVFCDKCKSSGATYTIPGALRMQYPGEHAVIYIAEEYDAKSMMRWINVGVTNSDYVTRYQRESNIVKGFSLLEYLVVDLNLAVLIELALHSTPELDRYRKKLPGELTRRNGRATECYMSHAKGRIIELLKFYINHSSEILNLPKFQSALESGKVTSKQAKAVSKYLESFGAPSWDGNVLDLPSSLSLIRGLPVSKTRFPPIFF